VEYLLITPAYLKVYTLLSARLYIYAGYARRFSTDLATKITTTYQQYQHVETVDKLLEIEVIHILPTVGSWDFYSKKLSYWF